MSNRTSKIVTPDYTEPGCPLPAFEDHTHYLGKCGIAVIPVLDRVALGFMDADQVEFYLGDLAGDFYIRLLPHHSLQEIGWKNQYAAWKDGDTLPDKPRNCVWTNHGFMYNINRFFDRQYEHIKDILHTEILSKRSLFAANKKRRKDDPWV